MYKQNDTPCNSLMLSPISNNIVKRNLKTFCKVIKIIIIIPIKILTYFYLLINEIRPQKECRPSLLTDSVVSLDRSHEMRFFYFPPGYQREKEKQKKIDLNSPCKFTSTLRDLRISCNKNNSLWMEPGLTRNENNIFILRLKHPFWNGSKNSKSQGFCYKSNKAKAM